MGTLTETEVKQTNQIYSTPRSLGDPVFLQVETGIVDGASGKIAETASIPFYSATGLIQLCMTFDNGTPSAISVKPRLYSDTGLSKTLSTDTYDAVFSVNPNVIWTVTNVGTRLLSEVYSVGRGWHKLPITDNPAVTGASAQVGIGFRDV